MEAKLRRSSAEERMQTNLQLKKQQHDELIRKTKEFKQKMRQKPLYRELEESYQKREQEAQDKKRKILQQIKRINQPINFEELVEHG